MIDEYNYNDEPSGRSDTLAMALDKCERLEKQLAKAHKILSDLAYCLPEANVYNRLIMQSMQYFRELEK